MSFFGRFFRKKKVPQLPAGDLNRKQAKVLWESAKKFYLAPHSNDPSYDVEHLFRDLARDFGLTLEQVRKALIPDREAEKAWENLYQAQLRKRIALDESKLWLAEQVSEAKSKKERGEEI